MSEFDQLLFEDGITNRVQESLNLFGEIVQSKWFKEASIILVCTKKDLFVERLKVSVVERFFDDYKGENDYESAKDFLVGKFLDIAARENKTIDVVEINLVDLAVSGSFETLLDLIAKKAMKSDTQAFM
jgi:hypothetical protein